LSAAGETGRSAPYFPLDPFEIEGYAEAIMAEAAGETWGDAIGPVLAWLAAELRRWPGFVDLPEQPADAEYFPAGYLRDCAALHAWLGCMTVAGPNPHRWENSRDRVGELFRLRAAMTAIALHRRQVVADVHVDRAERELLRQRQARAKLERTRLAPIVTAREAGAIRAQVEKLATADPLRKLTDVYREVADEFGRSISTVRGRARTGRKRGRPRKGHAKE
jgi:hypothetical protein